MSDLQITVEEVNADGVITKVSVSGLVEHYQHPDFNPSAAYTAIYDVSEITGDGLYAIYATADQIHRAYRKQGSELTVLYEQGTGYQGYRSATAQFVDRENFEPLLPSPVTIEFQGTVSIDANGSVQAINIIKNGVGYPATTQARITGDIVRATATAAVDAGAITSLTLTKPGQNYRAADTQIVFRKPSLTPGIPGEEYSFNDAELNVVFDAAGLVIQGIQVANGGSDYPSGIRVKFTNTRIDAVATATVTDGKLVSVNVVSPGTGYHPDFTTITFIDNATNLPIAPLQLPLVEPVIDGQGNLTAINVTQQGQGIPSDISVEVDWGIEAVEAFASIITGSRGQITSVTLTNPGAGYRPATVEISIVSVTTGQPVGRRKAVYEPVITAGGALTGFTQVDSGAGYPTADQIVVDITDNFSAAQATVSIGTNGDVVSFNVTQPGSGYFSAGIELIDAGSTVEPQPFSAIATATGVLRGDVLIGMEVLKDGLGYPIDNTAVLIEDKTAETCAPGSEAPNMWAAILGPEVYALAVAALTPQDPTFVRQEPVYDYCGRLTGYKELVVSGDRAADGGNPLDGAVTKPLELNHEFIWINAVEEGRVGWGVTGRESEQLVGPPGAKKLTMALDLNPEITLYRGQSHILSIPSGREQEFYIYETMEDPSGRPVVRSDGVTILLKPNIARRFSQGLQRFETGEYLDDANGRDENDPGYVWPPGDPGLWGEEPEVWKRQDLFPEGTNLLLQIGEGDPPKPAPGELDTDVYTETLEEYQARLDTWKKNKTGLVFWPEFLAYSNRDGTRFGILRLV